MSALWLDAKPSENLLRDKFHLQHDIWRLTAIEIAISASVTVSIGDDTSGAFRVMLLVSCDDRFTSSAVKSMYPGSRMKSLKRRRRRKVREIIGRFNDAWKWKGILAEFLTCMLALRLYRTIRSRLSHRRATRRARWLPYWLNHQFILISFTDPASCFTRISLKYRDNPSRLHFYLIVTIVPDRLN